MFQLRAPKCPNCHAPLKAGREVVEIDCGYCGAHVQVRKPKKQKQDLNKGYQQRSKQNNRGWKREIAAKHSAKRSGAATSIAVFVLVLVGSAGLAGWVFYSAQVENGASSTQGKTEALLATPMTGSQPPIPAMDVESAGKKNVATSKKKSKKHRRKKSKKSSQSESLLNPQSEERTESKGKLTKAEVGKILRSVRMLHCSASGKSSVSIVIAPSGKVQSAQASGDMPASEATCISDTVKALRFPPSDDGLRIAKRYAW